MSDPCDDALLLEAVDSREAFGRFYRRHERLVLGFFMRRTGDPELAADLAAETFAALLAGIERFDPARGGALAWLFGIASKQLLRARERGRVDDRARRRLGMRPLVLEDDLLERILRTEADQRVTALLAGLSDRQASAVRGHVVEGQPYRDLAAGLRRSESVVRQRVSRGLATLRASLKEPG